MKDHEERELPLSEELFDLLMQLRQKHLTSKLVFGTKNGKPNTKLLQLVKRRARRAGLNCGNCDAAPPAKSASVGSCIAPVRPITPSSSGPAWIFAPCNR